ncbi:MAG: CooT family nickel-binding protein [Candidatus Korarchaeum sp.]
MCEGTAYLVEGPRETLLMREVMFLLLRDGKLVLVGEEGDERTLEGVKELRIDMLRHEIRVSIG